jgi:integrase
MIRATTATIGEYVRDYELSRDLRPESVRQIQISAALIEKWHGSPLPLASLDERLLSEFLLDYQRSGKSPSTVRAKRVQLLALWRSAADEGLCRAPTRRVRRVSVPYTPPTAWTLEEAAQLVESCKSLKRRHKCGLRRADWWSLAIRIAWDTGLRWEDQTTRLRVDAITADGHIAIPQSKTGRVVVCRLSPSTLQQLQESLALAPRELATPWGSSHETFANQFRRIVAAAGVRRGTWKWLRRGSATDCELQRPGSGSVHLGHTPGSRIAERHYLDPAILASRQTNPRSLDDRSRSAIIGSCHESIQRN